MKNSFPQAILTLVVVGLAFVASSDQASARGGGGSGSGGSSSHVSAGPSYSNSRPSPMYSNNNRVFHPTSFNSFSAFSKNNHGTFPTTNYSHPLNLNKELGLGDSKGIHALKLAGPSGKPSNLLSKPFNKYGYGKYGKYGKCWHPWYGYCYPWYGCGGCCDYSCYCDNPYDSSCCSCEGYPTCGSATFADLASDPAAGEASDPAAGAMVATATGDSAAVAPAASPELSAGQVLVVNPAENQSTLAYSINSRSFTLKAGESQRLDVTPDMTIEFDRGLSGDPARYPLTAGTYTFKSTDKGWDLVSDSPSATPTPGLVLSAPQNDLVADTSQADPGIGVPQTSLSAGIRRK
jgi:hypothetical protein